MLSSKVKAAVIKKVQRKEGDTGSPEAQIALISKKIDMLASHLLVHKKDVHSRKGLLEMVSKRRSLLAYFQKKNPEGYQKLIKIVGLKK